MLSQYKQSDIFYILSSTASDTDEFVQNLQVFVVVYDITETHIGKAVF